MIETLKLMWNDPNRTKWLLAIGACLLMALFFHLKSKYEMGKWLAEEYDYGNRVIKNKIIFQEFTYIYINNRNSIRLEDDHFYLIEDKRYISYGFTTNKDILLYMQFLDTFKEISGNKEQTEIFFKALKNIADDYEKGEKNKNDKSRT